ncbi:R3H and coiled-coil domain-containing protein 1 isoform X1 [Silurus meridionalis]|uniref:R3H and coiled-coil domain-containing protein 1 isoform X1 n=1 Tax=Silurus meridionalis TaxID=175797 RepID=UPI001EECB0B7|nr:R3H and coiled-coil domain-containing protein 1 isoform X1 [Silurus meridionalis]
MTLFCLITSQKLIETHNIAVFSTFGTLAFPCFDGSYLPKQESAFVHKVLEELDAFQHRDNQKSVILFPPLPSRLRFLIHKTAEKFPELCTFSVGEAWSRRVAVCCSELRLPVEECHSDTDGNVCEQLCLSSREVEKKSRSAHRKGSRRPDKAIYIPRALRRSECETTLGSSSCSPNCSPSLRLSDESSSNNTDPPPANDEPDTSSINESVGEQNATECVAGTEPVACDQTLSYFMALTLEEEQSSTDESQATASCQNTEETDDYHQEIVAHLKEEPASIENVQNDFSTYENAWIEQDEFAHIIEIYDFPSMFKTDDLLDAFSEYSEGGMKIKWVDNTHALGVFSSASAALQALSIKHPMLKTRQLSQASKKSKGKVAKRAEFLQPVKERPRTDSAVARRMVTRALGLRAKRY